ncbi:MAG: acetoacetate--CoA ligase [Alphaproteobacteria bacterium]|nr:acetoacetate--CoA ligase [Alphaproteobacteria bacterium]OJV46489.1 MAG: acetoacetate--CoA ligase [Alphaproteobacteria bacterium 43-37]
MPLKFKKWEVSVNEPLWQPSPTEMAETLVSQFIHYVEKKHNIAVVDFHGLYQWSVGQKGEFWSDVWDFTKIIAEHKGQALPSQLDGMFKSHYFQDAKLNYAQNLLWKNDDTIAVISLDEEKERDCLSFKQLNDAVSKVTQHLAKCGLKPGDRVAGLVSNTSEALVAMLATAALGGVWCSCSPDFGVNGIMDRFGQIEPKIFVSVDQYVYAGKTFDIADRVVEIGTKLPSIVETIVISATGALPDLSGKSVTSWQHIMSSYESMVIPYVQVPFNHPLFITFTSGTTGAPKCIVHGVGGTLIQHLKEHQLHCDIKPNDRVFYFTTCGWMMWNWLVSALASQATLILFDGSPVSPNDHVLLDYAEKYDITHFGVSAKYIDSLKKNEVSIKRTHKLKAMRMILSTGSPLAAESYDFVYDHLKDDVCLSSISGGTDIISCFVLGSPMLPVWRGEIQTRGLGMQVEVFDDNGHPVMGEKGELVCTAPFPSMPIGFWNDPDDQKYKDAYFSRFNGIWCHGDWVELKSDGGLIIYGRSDAILNPGGVRIGTGEIYRQVEQIPEIVESIAVGQDWNNDVRIILFVKLKKGAVLDDELINRVKKQIRLNASPRHMPSKVIQVPDIPRTKSGKIVELAVRNVIHGRPVMNVEALANPEALAAFKNLPDLET